MHFTALYVIEGEEDLGRYSVEDTFTDNYCYCCGENHTIYYDLCDWYQVGGRWCDEIIKATKGIKGEKSWGIEKAGEHYSIANIKDLTHAIEKENIYVICDNYGNIEWSKGYYGNNKHYRRDFLKYLRKINTKQIRGTIALIDCHD